MEVVDSVNRRTKRIMETIHVKFDELPLQPIESDEFNQEDSADFDGNTQFVPYDSLNHEEIESSTTNLEPSNVQNFHQVQHLDSQLEIVHPLRPSIGDPIQTCYDSSTANYDSEDYGFELIAYSDADHAGCKDDCKSTSGGLQFLGGKLVMIWMRTQLLDYGFKYYPDSDNTLRGVLMEIYFVGKTVPTADLFTKALPKERFEYLVHRIVIIMAQQQHAADVHPDELCPPNKRYDLMDANKKVELEHVQCPSESKILMNIIKNHPLRFSIAASASVPWIYMAQFWHTLKEDGSKHRLKFLLDRKELTLTLDDFRTIFHLPQANDNNHASFVPPPSFSDMVPFYKQVLGFTMELKTISNFKIFGLLQPWQTLCKIFSKCLTTRVTGWDQPPLQIMQMLYCFVNNIHVDYAELMWEGIYYSLHHPATSIPYPRFTKIIISHYMTIFPDISRRARDAYHNLQDDDIMKNIFNSGRNKNKVGMRIPAWMITEEMKLMEHYKMYAEVFGLDVPLTQSQPTESTQGTHRTPSAPRSPNPATETAESSVPKRSTVIHFRLPSRQSARLTPPVPVPTAEKADEMILQDMIQVSLAEHKSHEEQEARENVALVYEHLAAEEIEKLVEDPELYVVITGGASCVSTMIGDVE
ncbi:hypothetical protein Tco_0723457, partial [Tanacetum coccineum]